MFKLLGSLLKGIMAVPIIVFGGLLLLIMAVLLIFIIPLFLLGILCVISGLILFGLHNQMTTWMKTETEKLGK